jgi:hypothetical protein
MGLELWEGACVERGTLHVEAGWVIAMARRLGLEHTLRPRGRRRKEAKTQNVPFVAA